MFAKLRKKQSGFTLVELLVVIVIIAVLAMIIIPHFADSGERSKEASLHSDLAELRSAIANYQADTGYYPATLNDLTVTTAPASGLDSGGNTQSITASNWHGPYLTTGVPTDPESGSSFNYSVTGSTTGKVTSSATGDDLAGTAFSTY